MTKEPMAKMALAGMLVSGTLAFLSYRGLQKPAREPAAPQAVGYGEVPDFRLTAVDGRSASFLEKKDLLGEAWIADFIFTSCEGPCPMLSANMARLQKRLPRRVRLVSFTVDPDKDTVPVLQRYAAQLWAEPGRWFFATGEKGELYRLLRDGFKLPVMDDPAAPAGVRVTHSTKFVLVDPRGVILGYYDGEDEASLTALCRDAAAAL